MNKIMSFAMITALPFFLFGAFFDSVAIAQSLSADDWVSKGAAFKKAKNYNKAIEAYSKAIVLNAEYAGAYVLRGIAYGNMAIMAISNWRLATTPKR